VGASFELRAIGCFAHAVPVLACNGSAWRSPLAVHRVEVGDGGVPVLQQRDVFVMPLLSLL